MRAIKLLFVTFLGTLGTAAFSSESCLMPMPATIRGRRTAWIVSDLTESQVNVKKVEASYWYSVVQTIHPELVLEEATLERSASDNAVYYHGVSIKSGQLIEMFGHEGYLPSEVRLANGS